MITNLTMTNMMKMFIGIAINSNIKTVYDIMVFHDKTLSLK